MADCFKRKRCKDHESWLAMRTQGIGGSDAACILGRNPWKTNVDLWREKTGLVEQEDISEKPAVKYGHQAEGSLRRLFKLDHPELRVYYRDNEQLINKALPYLHASLDGELTDESGRKGILEIKTTTILQSMQKENWNNRIPDNYYLQCLHYLLVTGYEFVVLRAQLKYQYPEELKIVTREYRIERSQVEEDMRVLLAAEIAFWEFIQRKEEPALILPPLIA
ncbi:MAG: YqaJ viral recombinase family protein [Eubacteriales bacterium]|nr:YqaJ viral recombinase family protein [Eubacteriales bacterium]